MMHIRKATIGQSYTFKWLPPAPVSGTPALTVRLGGSTYTGNMSTVSTSVDINSVDASRQVLTVTGSISGESEGLTGDEYGHAWLKAGDGGAHPVTIASIDSSGSCVTLARPLPGHVSIPATGATLEWAVYTNTIAGANFTTKAVDAEWSVSWSRGDGADAPTEAMTTAGHLRVVRAPFNTGVTTHALMRARRHFRHIGPQQGANDLDALIESGLSLLIEKIAPKIVSLGGDCEDDVKGSQFHDVHIACCDYQYRLDLISSGDVDQKWADDLDDVIDKRIDRIFQGVVWIDKDDDGVVDDGEVETVTAPSIAGGSYGATSEYASGGTFDRWSTSQDR